MKWVKFNSDFGVGGSLSRLADRSRYSQYEEEEVIKTCFFIIDSKDYKTFKNGNFRSSKGDFHEWVCHKGLPNAYFDQKYFENDCYKELRKGARNIDINEDAENIDIKEVKQHPYEIFIGGWLHFYDSEVQCGRSDHAVYFDWNLGNHSVTVYILQLKPEFAKRWNVYVDINPPGVADPPTPKGPPPPPCL
jgi:hypothetical protein